MRAWLHQLDEIRTLPEVLVITKAIIVFSNASSWIDSDIWHQ